MKYLLYLCYFVHKMNFKKRKSKIIVQNHVSGDQNKTHNYAVIFKHKLAMTKQCKISKIINKKKDIAP